MEEASPIPNIPPWNTSTFSRSSATSVTVMPSTARISRVLCPAICINGTSTSAPMEPGAPMQKPAR